MGMRTFKKANWKEEDSCPICKMQDEGEIVLIPIYGTQDGNNIQATKVHTECIGNRLTYYPDQKLLAIQIT